MSGNVIRRVALSCAAAALLVAGAVMPVAAVTPPTEGTSTCQAIDAGYSPAGLYYHGEWEWDGRLRWDLCVTRNSNGTVTAFIRLSSPSPSVLLGQYDRFTGTLDLFLQRCGTKGYTTLAQGNWDVAGHETGSLSGNWYRFSWRSTPSVAASSGSFRVRTKGLGAVVPRNGGWTFSLAKDSYPPSTSPPVYGISTSGCISL
jgi:hypothetical protein